MKNTILHTIGQIIGRLILAIIFVSLWYLLRTKFHTDELITASFLSFIFFSFLTK
jgi:ABC-type uncharacterized transport system permease subunit